MRKLVVAITVLAALTMVSRGAWAFDFKEGCSGHGYFVSTSGTTPLAFTLVQRIHWTGPGAEQFDSLSETINSGGLVCRYTLDTTQNSIANINPDGTGTNAVSLVGVAGNPSQCVTSFTAHNSFVATSTGSKFIGTDPGSVVEGDCLSVP